MQTLSKGATLQDGKYIIERVLGQGGFGITYLAKHDLLDTMVAIKEFFFKQFCDRDEATSQVKIGTTSNIEEVKRYEEKFLKEARIIAKLNHPNIIKIHDVFKENNTAYYVMEYIDGETLSEINKSRGALPENEAIGYIRQVGAALSYIHEHHLNHLDIKPSNLMLRKRDSNVILIDFGMSKQYDSVSGGQTSTTPVGISHGYAPIEQYKEGGVREFSPETDIYALGATLYKLLTDKTPLQATEIVADGWTPEYPTGVSDTTRQTIAKAMEVRKANRYHSVEIFLTELTETKTKTEEMVKPNSFANLISSSYEDKDETTLLDTESEKKLNSARENQEFNSLRDNKGQLSKEDEIHQAKDQDEMNKRKKSNLRVLFYFAFLILLFIVPLCIFVDGKYSEPAVKIQTKTDTSKQAHRQQEQIVFPSSKPTQNVQPNVSARIEQSSQSKSQPTRPTTGVENGHEWVDLGLSVKWATCNVGATKPEQYGNYYAWGETYPKSRYDMDNYKYYSEYYSDGWGHVTKYCEYSPRGYNDFTDNKKLLDLSDDAAHVNWGGGWRMPTKTELQELCSKCTSIKTTINGIKGRLFSSKKTGHTIFLPAANLWRGDGIDEEELLFPRFCMGFYWSSSLVGEENTCRTTDAYILNLNYSNQNDMQMSRSDGLTVRAVCP